MGMLRYNAECLNIPVKPVVYTQRHNKLLAQFVMSYCLILRNIPLDHGRIRQNKQQGNINALQLTCVNCKDVTYKNDQVNC